MIGDNVNDELPRAERAAEPVAVPLHGETASITRRSVQGATVQVTTRTNHVPYDLEQELYDVRVEIERRPVGRIVATDPGVIEEGDLTIIPVLAETIVSERRLLLVEEVHVRRVRVARIHRESVMLRTQEAIITRTPSAEPPPSDQPSTNQGDYT